MAFGRTIILSATIAATAGLVFAASHGGNPAVKARQSHMQLHVHNISILGAMAKGVPLRRLGTPDDIANAVSFLAKKESEYITGQTLSVSGGLTMS